METGLYGCVLRSVTNQRSSLLTACDTKIYFLIYVDRIKKGEVYIAYIIKKEG